jgi:pSer/pThr/pTyr-binding forkhead associated (FHA) protein
MQLYPVLAFVVKYVLIIIVYLFIYRIARLIYLDIKTITEGEDAKRLVPHVKALSGTQEVYALTKALTFVGRGSYCDIVLMDHHVSSKHARIDRVLDEGGRLSFSISDLKSANGTFLNGVKVVEAMALKEGDLISLGPLKLEFHEGGQHYA